MADVIRLTLTLDQFSALQAVLTDAIEQIPHGKRLPWQDDLLSVRARMSEAWRHKSNPKEEGEADGTSQGRAPDPPRHA